MTNNEQSRALLTWSECGGDLFAGVCMEWPLMKSLLQLLSVAITYLWKSNFLALRKPGKLMELFLLLCGLSCCVCRTSQYRISISRSSRRWTSCFRRHRSCSVSESQTTVHLERYLHSADVNIQLSDFSGTLCCMCLHCSGSRSCI